MKIVLSMVHASGKKMMRYIATGKLPMFAKTHNVNYLLNQKFLHPYPGELALRLDIRSGK